jgi:hypothetical protein
MAQRRRNTKADDLIHMYNDGSIEIFMDPSVYDEDTLEASSYAGSKDHWNVEPGKDGVALIIPRRVLEGGSTTYLSRAETKALAQALLWGLK